MSWRHLFLVPFLLGFVITACGRSPAKPPVVNPAQIQLTQAILPTSVPESSITHSSWPGEVSIEHAETIYYDITGSTTSELRESMNRFRPKDPYDGDKPVDSYTDWSVSWNWPGYGTEDCDLSAAVITYRIKVLMPRWKAPVDASPELISKWEEYMRALTLHERGHVENIVDHYLDVETAIRAATCSTAEAAAQKALVSLRGFDSSYDRETNHGATQGALFP